VAVQPKRKRLNRINDFVLPTRFTNTFGYQKVSERTYPRQSDPLFANATPARVKGRGDTRHHESVSQRGLFECLSVRREVRQR